MAQLTIQWSSSLLVRLFGGQGVFLCNDNSRPRNLLANAYGSLKIELNNQEVTIDNAHKKCCLSQTLDYNIHLEMGSGSLLGQERVLLIPLEEQVKLMFKAPQSSNSCRLA